MHAVLLAGASDTPCLMVQRTSVRKRCGPRVSAPSVGKSKKGSGTGGGGQIGPPSLSYFPLSTPSPAIFSQNFRYIFLHLAAAVLPGSMHWIERRRERSKRPHQGV